MLTIWVVKAVFAYLVAFHAYSLLRSIWRSP